MRTIKRTLAAVGVAAAGAVATAGPAGYVLLPAVARDPVHHP